MLKAHEAIAQLSVNGHVWARPIWWIGSGIAITMYSQTRLAVVPSATGGANWNVSVQDLLGDWEVIDPNVVLDEAHPSIW